MTAEPSGTVKKSTQEESQRIRDETETTAQFNGRLRQFRAAISGCLAAFVSGGVFGWTSSAYGSIVVDQSLGFPVSDDEFIYISSIMPLGGLLTCFFTAGLVEKVGRKNFLLLMLIPFTLSWILVNWPQNVFMLIIGRVLGGIGSGTIFAVVPAHITEFAEKEIRGSLSSCYTLMFIGGAVYAYILGALFDFQMIALNFLAITALFGVCLWCQPETPAFYIRNGNGKKAREVLSYFRGDPADVSKEYAEIENRELKGRACDMSLKDCLKRPADKRAVWICISLQIFQQITGIEALFFFQKKILDDSHLSFSSDIATVFIGLIHLTACFVATLFVDKVGRKLLLLTSGTIISVCCAVLGAYYMMDPALTQAYSYVPVVSMATFRAVYALGFGPMPYVIISEILPEEIKNVIGSTTGVFGYGLVFGTTFLFPYSTQYFGMGQTFLFFGVGSIVSVFYVSVFVPETKKKSLDDIQGILEDGRGRKTWTLPVL